MSAPNSRPPSRSSGAISSGADLLVALFQEERKKREAANVEKLRDLESRFKHFREYAEMRHAKVVLKVQEVEVELEKMKENLLRAGLDNLEVYAALKRAEAETACAKSQLDAIKFSLETFGMTYSDDLVIRFDDKPAQAISQLLDEIGANSEKISLDANRATMGSIISSLTQYFRLQKRSMNEWAGKYRMLEQERDSAMRGLDHLLSNPTIAAYAELLAPPTSISPKVEVSSSTEIQLPPKSGNLVV